MKKFSVIFYLLLIYNLSYSQSDWNLSNTGVPEKFNTYDFIVKSSSEIYAIGALFDGTPTPSIYKSTNNGDNWSELSVSGMESHNYLYSASCIMGSKMFVNASNSTGTYAIYSSTNGTSWTASNSGIPDKFSTYDFIVSSSSEIYAVGALFDGTPSPTIYKSTNSGVDWSELSISGMESHDYLYSASCIAGSKMFINASNSSGTYAIYSSTNGTSWSLSNTGIPEKFNTYDFITISTSEIYAIGSLFDGSSVTPKIYKSTDSGSNWSELTVTGMDSHDYLYSASCKTDTKMFINASNNTGTYAIYSSTFSNVSNVSVLNSYNISVFPNPTKEYLNITSQENFDEIRVKDLNGRILKSSTHDKIFVGDLQTAIYLVDIVKNYKTIKTIKIIVD